MSRGMERAYPYLFPVVIVYLCYRYDVGFPSSGDILISSITLASIFLGFLVTAKSILLGLQTPEFRSIRKTKYFPLLLCYLSESVYSSLFYSTICLAAYFYKNPASWATLVWAYLTGVTLLSFFRVVRVFMVLISYPPAD